MKKRIKGMIVFFSVLLVGLSIFLIYALIKAGSGAPVFPGMEGQFSAERLVNTQTVDIKDITELEIENYSCDVFFLNSDQEEMVIKEYASRQLSQNSFVTVHKNRTALNIEAAKKKADSRLVFGNNHRYIKIYLPLSYKGSVRLSSESGDILADMDLSLAGCSIQTSSGNIRLKALAADQIILKSGSGDILAETLDGEKEILTESGYADISTSIKDTAVTSASGDVKIDRAEGRLDIRTSSGEVLVNRLNGSAGIETSSGDIHLSAEYLNGDLDMSCSSGEVYCDLPKDVGFKFQADTDSGEISTDFDQELSFDRKGIHAEGTVGTAADISVNVRTTSGDISIDLR